jgi:glycosyltransferase involved in cell wall biosynthesis
VKLAFITPRYGADISTGPEHACRLLAEHVHERHQVEVLTTCARERRSWRNEYAEGTDRVRGVLVRRFAATQAPGSRPGGDLPLPPISPGDLEWVAREGPWSAGLLEHLRRQHRGYDALVFFGLPSLLTVHGVTIAPDRTVLFPWLQPGPDLRRGLWRHLTGSARALGLVSEWERRLLRGYLGVTGQQEEVVGIGVETPHRQSYPRHQQDPADALESDRDLSGDEDPEDDTHLTAPGAPFRRRHRLYGPLVFYGGRVEADNGCEELLEYFDGYAADDPDVSLVLMGVKLLRVPDAPYLRMPGVLPDRERMVAFEAANVVVAPLPDDLLAQPVLESFAVGTPVLVNARNDAAVEHCRRANAGLYYGSRAEFVEALRLLLHDTRLRTALAANGRTYIRQQFRWEAVLGRFDRLVGGLRG